MQKAIIFPNKFKERLSGILHVPKLYRDGVILSHCFTCSKHHTIMRRLAKRLCQAKYLALRFDYSGNGESEGTFEESTYTKQISDLKSAIRYMQKKVKRIYLIGHSKGASISILAGTDKKVTGICVLSGQSDSKDIKTVFSQETLQKVKKNGKASFSIFGREYIITKKAIDDSTKYNIIKTVSNLKKPFYIIHGTNDKIIPVSNAKKLFKAANNPKQIDIIPDADHFYTNDLETTIDKVILWLDTCKP